MPPSTSPDSNNCLSSCDTISIMFYWVRYHHDGNIIEGLTIIYLMTKRDKGNYIYNFFSYDFLRSLLQRNEEI